MGVKNAPFRNHDYQKKFSSHVQDLFMVINMTILKLDMLIVQQKFV